MTTYYIDPTVSASGVGTIGDPFKLWSDAIAGVANWAGHTFLQKCGTDTNLATAISKTNNTGVTLGNYGSGSKPIVRFYATTETGDWADQGSNVWRYTSAGGTSPVFIRFGTIALYGIRVAAALDVDADTEYYISSNTVDVYSVGNPVTYYGAVYIGAAAPFTFAYCQNLVVADIAFRDVAYPVVCSIGADGTYANYLSGLDTTNCQNGPRFQSTQGSARYFSGYCKDCTVTDATAAGIYLTAGFEGFRVSDNTIRNVCLNYSNGGIYADDTTCDATHKLIITRNDISEVEYGNYFTGDGGAIECDSGAEYVIAYANYLHDTEEAIHDNSGGAAMRYESNLIVNCERALWITSTGVISFIGNTVTNNTNSIRALYANKASGAVTIQNNVVVGSSSFGIQALDETTSNLITESNNCFYGFTTPRVWGSVGSTTTVALDSTSTTENPGLTSSYQATSSSCMSGGVWAADVKAYDDLPHPLHPDIGAVQDRNASGRKFGVGGGAL